MTTGIDIVQARYVASVLPGSASQINRLRTLGSNYAASLQHDGRWGDISYQDRSPAQWQTSEHLERTLVMAKMARFLENHGQPDSALNAKVCLALHTWVKSDYRNPNWWWNEIGVPELVGEIATLMEADLPADDVEGVIAIMKRSDWRRAPWTGANLTWGVTIEIVRGCLQNDAATVAEGYRRLYEEIKIVSQKQEGIQQDDSFHQHGAQLYSGGYGLSYAADVGRFIAFSWGTAFQIPADRMAIFSSYLLDGEQWLISGDVIDYSVIGREITRQGLVALPQDWTVGPISPSGPAYSLENVVAMLAAEPTPRQREFQAFAAWLEDKPNAPSFTGNKQFWCSDFMAHRGKAFYTSIKMLSTRIQNAELVNGEGTKSEHLSDGANFLFMTGDEYMDIFPEWDWTKVPGTTAIQGTLDTGEKNPIGARGGSDFAGGVSDGSYGMAAMNLRRGDLSAEKAWFFFDHSYVCLGAGISLTGAKKYAAATDVNQTLLKGPVFTSLSPGAESRGLHGYTPSNTVWIYHDHVGYILPPGTHLSLSLGPQTGRWSDIGSGSSTPGTRNVFNLWIDHGVSPRDASYQYTVIPNVSPEEVARRGRRKETRVLANTADAQAVWNKGLDIGMFAFRKPASLSSPAGPVTVDHACLVMLRRIAHRWMVSASNPENQPLLLHVKVGKHELSITLPGGNMAGSTVTSPIVR